MLAMMGKYGLKAALYLLMPEMRDAIIGMLDTRSRTSVRAMAGGDGSAKLNDLLVG